jgi:rRNA-processing protein FCF1
VDIKPFIHSVQHLILAASYQRFTTTAKVEDESAERCRISLWLSGKNELPLSSQLVITVHCVHYCVHYRCLTLRLILATVLRELDGLKKRYDIGLSARVALRWIEDCMEKKPFWMHVQRSTEVLQVRRTQDRGFMSPTNDDQILECALLFDREVMDGRVVLLTRDTALKIKAMAEVCSQLTSCCHFFVFGFLL